VSVHTVKGSRACDRRVLASWIREDGFFTIAEVVESAPPAFLPVILRMAAKHIARHPHYFDEEARILPEILWQEAEVRDQMPSVNRFRHLMTGVIVVSLFLLTAHLDYRWA